MNYEEVQQLRRDILAGRFCAPPFPVLKPAPPRRPRKKTVVNVLHEDDEWNEEAFQDNFYEGEEGETEEDVVPEYFHDCDRLVTVYADDEDMDEDTPMKPLFAGSPYTAKDLARFLLSFKARHLKVGDGILANIVAIMATFLPGKNIFRNCLPASTSTYSLLKTLDNLASYKTNLRTLKIHCCVNKCQGFYGDKKDDNFCSVCEECRWKRCTSECYVVSEDADVDDLKLCQHMQTPRQVVYYNVVQDRLVKLLKSDLRNLFDYPSHRGGKLHSTCP
jgi:hypothetical protein